MIEVFFLGTGGSVPGSKRRLPLIVMRRKGEIFVFDCGEGAQYAFIKSKLGVNKPTKIFITHMHGDHVLGLPGLIMTFSMMGRDKPIQIFGPPGIKLFLSSIFYTTLYKPSFKIEIFEIRHEGCFLDEEEYFVEAYWGEHVIPSLIFSFNEKPRPGRFNVKKALALGIPRGPLWKTLQKGQPVSIDGRVIRPEDVLSEPRPGIKIVYSGDTAPSSKMVKIAEKADLLIHEATLPDNLASKVFELGHTTPSKACQIAKKAGVKKLYLTHISPRIVDEDSFLASARKIFPNVKVARDDEIIIIKHS